MQVEAFDCTETASEPIEASEEAVRLMEELGLEGQKSLVTKSEKSGRDTRCPYREMTKDEAYVYKVLCPEETALSQYSRSPIPLRVLQIAAHANDLGIFKKLVVWDRKSAVVKDPVLVAYGKPSPGDWRDSMWILARWGEELEAFTVLSKRALSAKRAEIVDGLQRIANSIAGRLSTAQEMTDDELMGLGANATAKLDIG